MGTISRHCTDPQTQAVEPPEVIRNTMLWECGSVDFPFPASPEVGAQSHLPFLVASLPLLPRDPKALDQGLLPGVNGRASSATGLRRNTSLSHAFLASSFDERNIPCALTPVFTKVW